MPDTHLELIAKPALHIRKCVGNAPLIPIVHTQGNSGGKDNMRHARSFACAILYCTLISAPLTAAAQGFTSGTVTAGPYVQATTGLNAGTWSFLSGYGTGSIQTDVSGPNGTTVTKLTVATTVEGGTFIAKYDLPVVMDLRPYDNFNFVTMAAQTRIGGFVYLIDSSGRRRWYHYVERSWMGWQQPVYTISNYIGEDAHFDVSHIQSFYFTQSGMAAGDVISVGSISLDIGLVDHCDYSSNWSLDWVSTGSLTNSTDAVSGTGSVLANIYAVATGQADVAILGSQSGINWDWSNKSYVTFSFKDSNTTQIHYFLIYDKNRNYREWLFTNAYPDQWITVTGDLNDTSYYQSAPVDLTNIQQFEVGIFGGSPYQNYVFQIDEVRVR
jgi:hypothetical protein